MKIFGTMAPQCPGHLYEDFAHVRTVDLVRLSIFPPVTRLTRLIYGFDGQFGGGIAQLS